MMLSMRDLTTRSRVLLLVTVLTALVIAYNLKLTSGVDAKPMRIATVAESPMPPNLLLAKWEGPYGGVPPFDRVKVTDFKPALEAAMTENLADVGRIAKDPAAQPLRTPSLQWSVPGRRSIVSRPSMESSVRL
jgi:hypothetical protein